jgi:hypothetical protein
MKIAHFHEDITPPVGHPLCGGWCPPATAIGDRLSAHGVILFPEDAAPVVLCVLDWAELGNLEHLRWREALARAVGTPPERVTVHCLHAHDTPWPDEEAQAILDAEGFPGVIMDREWCRTVREAVASAAGKALERSEPVDTVRFGHATVTELASNRRPMGADGKVIGIRWTQCRDASLRALPEGIIDPELRTISFWRNGRKLLALHYYTVHPTSLDHTGIVTPDFPGLARDQLSREEGVTHLYFTGCAGNITPGKYNDGVTDNRELFTRKIYEAMRDAEARAEECPAGHFEWRTASLRLNARPDRTDAELMDKIRHAGDYPKRASRAALELAFRRRLETTIIISELHFGKEAALLHLPGEAFVEYQLYAQSLLPEAWVGVAAYGDLGPGYICMERSLEEGGYEPNDAFCAPESEHALKQAIRRVLVDKLT